jgi:hypothetical protein
VDASNRPCRQPAARRPSRRSACQRAPAPPGSETQADGLTVTIRVLPLEGEGAEEIAQRQLAVIVRLLRRAAEAKQTATGDQE